MKGYQGNKKVAIVFSGGPAPAANAVISSVALNFLDEKIPVVGIFHGFEFLERYNENDRYSLVENIHFENLGPSIARIRNRRGVYLKTSRANPGKDIRNRDDLRDSGKNQKLARILAAFDKLGVGFLVTIGGDDTLKTANYLSLMGLPVIHIPKTIDNDYFGIPWTFGYWSAVQAVQEAILNLKADAQSTDAYFIVELMGRKAGWITYAGGIAGEAVMMLATEDVTSEICDLYKMAERMVDTIVLRERNNKYYGVICVAEGLADKLPEDVRPTQRDKHGNIIYGTAEVGRLLRDRVQETYRSRTGRNKKIIFKQIGYETRNETPISFDVVLGSMLGYGASKLFREGTFNAMVSVADNFSIIAVPFTELIDPQTLKTRLRHVPRESDFFKLKDALSFKLTD